MFNNDDLVKSVRVRAMLPDASQGSLSSDALLGMASEELSSNLVPMIMSAREHYYETYTDVPLVSGISIYPIPPRAIGMKIALLQYVYANSVTPLNPIDPFSTVNDRPGLYPKAFYYQNAAIVIYPMPSMSQGVLRMRFYQAPSILTATLNCSQVSGVDSVNNTVNIVLPQAGWINGTKLDFLMGTQPYTPYGVDSVSLGNNVGGDHYKIGFAALPKKQDGSCSVTVGDWLAPAGYTPIPEIPNVFFTTLAQATAVRALAATGANEHLQPAMALLSALTQNALKLIDPRDDWGLKKVCSNWRDR